MKKIKIKLVVLLALALAAQTAAQNAWVRAVEWPTNQNYVTCKPGDGERWRVRMLQHLLRAKGYTVVVDGSFGQQTSRALRLFQRRNGLSQTGIARDAEWKRLVPTLRLGSQGEAVRALQIGINRFIQEHQPAHTRPIPVDGRFGKMTQKWLRSAQETPESTSGGVADSFAWFTLLFDEH